MNKLLAVLLILNISVVSAQEVQQFNLDQCIKYALENHENIKAGKLDLDMAQADIIEVRSQGLPQIKTQGEFQYFYEIPTSLIPASSFNPNAPDDEFMELKFGTDYNTKVGVTASQLLFSGSYLVGLKVVKGYKELMNNALTKTKIDVVEAVTKAYYNVLIMNERSEVIDANMDMLVELYKQNEGLYKAGFIEKIEVDKVEVSLNNLKIEKSNFENYRSMAYDLLKFQMGMNLQEPMDVAEILEGYEIPVLDSLAASTPESRIEYTMMMQESGLYGIEKKLNQAAYLPSLAAFANHSYNSMGNDLGDALTGKWYPTGIVGLTLNFPLFTGFSTKAKIQKSTIRQLKVNNNMEMFKRAVELETAQAHRTLKNAINKLESTKTNMNLAERVYNNTVEMNKSGVKSVIEVTSSYTEFRTAQTNYYDALYEVVVAKINLDKAKGELKY